jgi:hypothetical protein
MYGLAAMASLTTRAITLNFQLPGPDLKVHSVFEGSTAPWQVFEQDADDTTSAPVGETNQSLRTAGIASTFMDDVTSLGHGVFIPADAQQCGESQPWLTFMNVILCSMVMLAPSTFWYLMVWVVTVPDLVQQTLLFASLSSVWTHVEPSIM